MIVILILIIIIMNSNSNSVIAAILNLRRFNGSALYSPMLSGQPEELDNQHHRLSSVQFSRKSEQAY